MNKKLQLFEHIKTAILVVLFFTTILLLYLCLNQSGNDFTISDIIPGGRTNEIIINVGDYIKPNCFIQSKGQGKYNLSFDTTGIDRAVDECAGHLLSSSTISIEKSTKEEVDKVALEEDSIIITYSFSYPFDDYCKKLIEKTVESENKNIFFNAIVFSDKSKECIYLIDSADNCYKVISGENYYSTDRIEKEFAGKVFHDINAENLDSLTLEIQENNLDVEPIEIEIASEDLAENIFGETFDFIRKITDNIGNETYMYGYGEKRLTVYVNGDFEFKEDVASAGESNFYKDLETALLFDAKAIDFDGAEFKLTNVKLMGSDNYYYQFQLENGCYRITNEVMNSKVSYFRLQEY
ncbi:MAG: hypothetical protein Q4F55_02410 [Bacillota bacterium]|nr:hypothetical protein [Bacillota bacterium]